MVTKIPLRTDKTSVRCIQCKIYSLLLCGLFYKAICFNFLPGVILFQCFQSFEHCDYLVLGRERDLMLGLFVRLFDFRFLLVLVRAAVCDCGTPWTFLLPFLALYQNRKKWVRRCHNYKSQQILNTKRKRKETQTNTQKTNKHAKSTQNSSLKSEILAMLKGLKTTRTDYKARQYRWHSTSTLERLVV